jgi:uncharacterized phiE125 gp8 family phage protein
MSSMNTPVLSLITAADALPITVDYARKHIAALTHDDDVLIRSWIAAATQWFEEITGRQLITATWEQWRDRFPCGRHPIQLPKPPLQSVVSVQYIDSSGDLVPFSDGASPETLYYQTKAPQGPHAACGWIEPLYGRDWPIARCETGAVRIQFTSGYGTDMDAIPEQAIAALCFMVGHLSQNRSAVEDRTLLEVPLGVQMLLTGFKYTALPTLSLEAPTWP